MDEDLLGYLLDGSCNVIYFVIYVTKLSLDMIAQLDVVPVVLHSRVRYLPPHILTITVDIADKALRYLLQVYRPGVATIVFLPIFVGSIRTDERGRCVKYLHLSNAASYGSGASGHDGN